MQKGSQNHEYKTPSRKRIENISKNIEQLNRRTLKIIRFSLGKTHISQKSHVLDLFETVIEKVIENDAKIHQKNINNSIQNRGAEKYRKCMSKYQKKGRTWSPKVSQKSTKLM